MQEDKLDSAKQALLNHIQELFEEIEKETVMSHQEKYALLEDACASASDVDELKVAFEQWHSEHAEDVGFEQAAHEIWDEALGGEEAFGAGAADNKEDVEVDAFEEEEKNTQSGEDE